jgi:hypothetical protein
MSEPATGRVLERLERMNGVCWAEIMGLSVPECRLAKLLISFANAAIRSLRIVSVCCDLKAKKALR